MAEMDTVDKPTLQQIFEAGWDAQKKVDSGEIVSNTDDFKICVANGISSLERATRLVNQLSLFSSNESVEEIATSDLKYILLPALLGDLTLQVNGDERLDNLRKARVYFVDYLQRCKSYSITTDEPPSQRESLASSTSAQPPTKTLSFEKAAVDRSTKIARLKAKREMEKKIKDLSDRLKAVSDHDRDDEIVRENLLTVLKFWVVKCQENVSSTDQEIELLEGMGRMRDAPGNYPIARQPVAGPPPVGQASRPPLVITRDMLENKVFGTGYPSLPAMSLEQFYEQTYKEQVEQQKKEEAVKKSRVPDEDEEAEKDETEESLRKAREFDDFKDTHRRGWGNKKNMG